MLSNEILRLHSEIEIITNGGWPLVKIQFLFSLFIKMDFLRILGLHG